MRQAITVVLLLTALWAEGCSRNTGVTTSDKEAFLALLAKLPSEGDFYTKESVTRAGPYVRVLFALTPKDIAQRDFYPFGALSAGLAEREEFRRFGVEHFSEIAHPRLKQFWAVILFNKKCASPEIVEYLRLAFASETQSTELMRMLGVTSFDKLKKSVTEFESKNE